jgi:EmrB/QacA subfamily drug resistance transporter
MTRARRYGVLAICCMSLFIVALDNTIVNVGLPSIGRDLHAGVSGLQWTIDAYTLVLASLLVLSGSTADRLGRKRTFQTGLVLFSLGSLLCSLAPNLPALVAFRALQAVGGSMLNPVAMSIIANVFVEPRERAHAIGMWAATVGVAMGMGPVVGGLLVTSIGWRAMFWINVPIGLAACVLTLRYVPRSRASRQRRIDPVGQLLVIVALATITFGIIEGPAHGWTSALILGAFAIGATSVVALLAYEPRRRDPLLELRFFRSVPFSGAAIIAVAGLASLAGFLFVNTLYLQDARGLSALQAGLDTLPMAGVTVIAAPLSGRVVARYGTRPVFIVAGAGLSASALLLTQLSGHTAFWWLFCAYVLFGVGYGVINAPITNTAVSAMPRAQAGVAAAIVSTSRQVGQTLGVAVIGVLATAGVDQHFASRLPAASHTGWWILVGLGLVVLIVGLASSSRWAQRSAERMAAGLHPDDRPDATAVPAAAGAS